MIDTVGIPTYQAYGMSRYIDKQTTKYGYTPLYLAASNGQLKTVQHLLNCGASLTITTKKTEQTPLDAVETRIQKENANPNRNHEMIKNLNEIKRLLNQALKSRRGGSISSRRRRKSFKKKQHRKKNTRRK
jgi:ankyrin repeat protein